MPRPVSNAILNAKKLGKRFNLIHIDTSTALYLTDNTFNYTYESNSYLANGLLKNVDVGAMTAGVNANDWEVELSGVLDEVYSGFLALDLLNRWVYHYVAYFEEDADGINIVGVETKKYGQILNIADSDDDDSASILITITGPLGNANQNNESRTNTVSQERKWGSDKIFQFAHETDFALPSKSFTGLVVGGTPVTSIPDLNDV